MADSKQYRSQFYRTNFVFLILVIGVLFLLNLTSSKTSRLKLDLSRDGIYSISPAAVEILGKLKDDITVEYYCSEELASFLPTLPRDTVDMFEEFRRLSGGKFNYRVINPEEDRDDQANRKTEEYLDLKKAGKTDLLEEPEPPVNPMSLFGPRKPPTPEQLRQKRDELASEIARTSKRDRDDVYRELLLDEWEKKYERDLQQQGIYPFIFQDRKASSVRQVKVYSAIKISYLDKQPEVLPQYTSLEGAEYELCHALVKLTTETKPTVAFFDARKPESPPFDPMNPMQRPPGSDYQSVIEYLGNLFDVREIGLKEGDSVDDLVVELKKAKARRERELAGEDEPEDEDDGKYKDIGPEDLKLLKCLIVAQPHNLEDRQVYEVNRAVSRGIQTIFLVSPYSMNISPEGLRQGIPLDILSGSLDEMFEKWGLRLGDEVLASNTSGVIMITRRIPPGIPVQTPIPLAVIVAAERDGINQETPYTNRISELVFPATTGLVLDTKALEKNRLAWSKLVETTEETWSTRVDPLARLQNQLRQRMGPGINLDPDYREDLLQRKDPESFRDFIEPVTLAVELRGKFPFIFEGEKIPEWKKEEKGDDDDGKSVEGDLLPNPDDPAQEETAESSGPEPAEASKAEDAPAAESSAPSGGEASPAEPASEESAPAGGAEASPEKTAEGGGKSASESKEGEAEKDEAPRASLKVAEGRVIVLGSVDMLKDSFIQYYRSFPGYRRNVDLLQNIVELFGLDDLLSRIRRKTQTVQHFEPGSEKDATWIQGVNLVAVPLLVAVAGLLRFVLRRAASIRYEREYMQKHHIS